MTGPGLAAGRGRGHLVAIPDEDFPMPQARGRIFDDLASLMTNAAGVASGVKREAGTAVRSQVERILAGMNVVTREEFEAVREMAALARDENEELRRRIAALEAR
jgi:BMFP domain-containing protein YqiC